MHEVEFPHYSDSGSIDSSLLCSIMQLICLCLLNKSAIHSYELNAILLSKSGNWWDGMGEYAWTLQKSEGVDGTCRRLSYDQGLFFKLMGTETASHISGLMSEGKVCIKKVTQQLSSSIFFPHLSFVQKPPVHYIISTWVFERLMQSPLVVYSLSLRGIHNHCNYDSSWSWQAGVHILQFKHNNSLFGELFWEQMNLHTNTSKENCMHHWDTGKKEGAKLRKRAK